ncbi:hypothetical protein J4438_02340 [Candidatus Woesearchaeota archaeon]|nr:hypothetical protein [Candidatus Woesearchaeota archaeon]
MDQNIILTGLENFDDIEKTKVNLILNSDLKKIKGFSGTLQVQGKKLQKQGKKSSYVFTGKYQLPEDTIYAESNEWELEKALHSLINKVNNSVKHKYKK